MTHPTRPDDPAEALTEALADTAIFELLVDYNFRTGYCATAETIAKEDISDAVLPFLTALRARGYDVVKTEKPK